MTRARWLRALLGRRRVQAGPVQWYRTPVEAVDAATEMIGQIRHEALA